MLQTSTLIIFTYLLVFEVKIPKEKKKLTQLKVNQKMIIVSRIEHFFFLLLNFLNKNLKQFLT